METLANSGMSWLLILGALLLGLRHGFDADHLAAVDSMTRLNVQSRRPFAGYCGALFSLGHGSVVMVIAVLLGGYAGGWQPAPWLRVAGGLISVALVGALGLLNLRAVLNAPPGEAVAPVGLKSRLMGAVLAVQGPWRVALVGTLFALSFDTLGIAALFAVAAGHSGAGVSALLPGVVFTAGMMLVDGLNGWWLARLLERAGRHMTAASRFMGWTVAIASLLVAILGAISLLSPACELLAGRGLWLVTVALLLVTLVCLLAGRWKTAPGVAGNGRMK